MFYVFLYDKKLIINIIMILIKKKFYILENILFYYWRIEL